MTATTAKRQSRFERATRITGLILQERDRRILTACYHYRYLTRSQLQRLFGIGCVTRINLRLRKLWDHRYLERRFLPNVAGSAEAIYLLGNNGVSVVANMLGIDAEEVLQNRALNLAIKETTLPHDLAVNDFQIAITKEIDADKRFELKRWWDPRECEQPFKVSSGNETYTTTLRPDGLLQILFGGQLYSFFVELDLSTSGLRKLKDKFVGYAQFLQLGLAKEAFGISKFYLLVITRTPERRENLRTLANEANAQFTWLATEAELKVSPLTAAVWRRCGQEALSALFEAPKVKVRVQK